MGRRRRIEIHDVQWHFLRKLMACAKRLSAREINCIELAQRPPVAKISRFTDEILCMQCYFLFQFCALTITSNRPITPISELFHPSAYSYFGRRFFSKNRQHFSVNFSVRFPLFPGEPNHRPHVFV